MDFAMFFSKLISSIITRPYLKKRLGRVGKNFRIGYSSILLSPESFCIGNDFFSGPYSYFSSNKDTPIVIGDSVMLGPYCKIIGGNHNIKDTSTTMMKAPYLGAGKGVVIEDDVWIGAGAIILDGSYISEGTVIAAGAVLSSKTLPYCVYGGVPARFIKYRFSIEEIKEVSSNKYSQQDLVKIYNEKL